MKDERLEVFFNPKSIAVIGASRNPVKVGYQIVYNLKRSYRGKIFPVNPKATEILGLKAYPSVKDIPEPVDLAVISIPAPRVPNAVKECGEKGVKGVIVISGGFKEIGPEGAKLEKQVVEIARQYNIRLLGPNVVGTYVPKTGVNTTFINPERQGFPDHGPIAFLSQSGAFGIAVLDWAAMRGIGLSKFVSLGNKADINESDLLEYLIDDEDTRVITMYIEGVEDGRRFMDTLRRTTIEKPVIVLKSGRTEAGSRAIASHTGSLAGTDQIYTAVFKQTGTIRAYGMEELFDMATALALQPPARGNRVAILTVGGGSGVMAADACMDLGLKVPKLSEQTEEKLRKILLPIASPHNPVDVTGSARDEHLVESVEVLMRSNEIDIIIWIPYFMVPAITEQLVEKFVKRVRRVNQELETPVPVVGAATGGTYTWKQASRAEKMGIPMYLSVERAAKAAWALYKYGEWLKKNNRFSEYIEKNRKVIGY